jgi:ATP-dependent Clp protease ATP-binding subunit ClpC
METIQKHLDTFKPVMAYEETLGRTSLTFLRVTFFILFIFCLSTIIVIDRAGGEFSKELLGCAMIFFALWLEQMMLYCYHNSFYFKGFDSKIGSGNKDSSGISYEVAQILLASPSDITASFLMSPLGNEVMIRSGLTQDALLSYLQSNRTFLRSDTVPLKSEATTDVYDLGLYIYMYDMSFKNLLAQNAVVEDIYTGALGFVVKNYIAKKRVKRWWSRDRLSLHPGLGRGLSLGISYELQRFSSRPATKDIIIDQNSTTVSHSKIIKNIEETLARSKTANILLIGEAGSGALDIIASVAARIKNGSGLNALAGLEFLVLDSELLLSMFTEKNTLENELLFIFDQAAASGTTVVVLPDISHVIEEAQKIDVDLPYLLEVYLTLPTLHFIGIDTAHNYHKNLLPLKAFVRRFEEISLESTNVTDTVTILEPIALRQEARRGVLFTYAAIVSIAENAERYLTSGVMPERAIDLIHEIAQSCARAGTVLITNSEVEAFVSQKTGIPVGPISPPEKNRLLNLEQILHERVVGQNTAVRAIASTMRRARVDITRADKPIGSFLFLGPTGVGKTETAKALAFTFFGAETNMIRFDMSEFSGEHTLGHLIGDEGGTGILTDKLHEHPYSVVLLDEFEKAAESVHDLFLQILDEGYFTSNNGDQVNARNTIIIATSNAGSDLIAKTSAIRTSLPHLDADIIDHVIETRVFKLELINRFDNTIIFEPLNKNEQMNVARLLLTELTTRVMDQGYHLTVSDELLAKLVDVGYDPQTSGRDIGRVLQNVLEEKIAKKIINGEVKIGGNLNLKLDDFTEVEFKV